MLHHHIYVQTTVDGIVAGALQEKSKANIQNALKLISNANNADKGVKYVQVNLIRVNSNCN